MWEFFFVLIFEVELQVFCDDLFGNMELNHLVDILLFNPPYVPTDDDEVGRDDIYASWAGGEDGVGTLEKLIPKLTVC